MPNTSLLPAGRHAGLGELLGEDHLLERRQPGAAVLGRPARGQVAGRVQHRAPRVDEAVRPRRSGSGRCRPSCSAASRPGTPGPCRGRPRPRDRMSGSSTPIVHELTCAAVAVGTQLAAAGQRGRTDERRLGAERRDVELDAVLGPVGAGAHVRRAGCAGPARAGPRRAAAARTPPGTAPARSTRRRSNTATAEATARPIIIPVRSITDAGARRSGRLVSSSIADDRHVRRRGSPIPPHGHGRPSGSTTTWPSAPALPRRPCSSRPLQITPASTASDISSTMTSSTSRARPLQRSASTRAWPAGPSTVGSPDRSRTRSRSSKPCHTGRCSGVTVPRTRSIGTLAADAARLQRVGVVGPGGHDAAHQPVQRRPHVARRCGDPIAHDDLTGLVDDAGGQPVGADVDRQVGRHDATVPALAAAYPGRPGDPRPTAGWNIRSGDRRPDRLAFSRVTVTPSRAAGGELHPPNPRTRASPRCSTP